MSSDTPSSNVQQMIWSLLAPIPDWNTSPISGQTMDLTDAAEPIPKGQKDGLPLMATFVS